MFLTACSCCGKQVEMKVENGITITYDRVQFMGVDTLIRHTCLH